VTLSKKPVVDCSARAIRIHLNDDNVPVICPTCQTHFLLFKTFIRLAITSPKTEKPAAVVSATGSRHLRDDANVHLICPTCQTLMKMQQNQLGRLKPILQTLLQKEAAPAAAVAARAL
jgi:predicted RNA-binding Zn-ribbon protein involved in translation (DUF1610 family)